MADSERIELRVSAELLEKIDRSRGEVPRATWIKGRLSEVVDCLWAPRVSLGPVAAGLPGVTGGVSAVDSGTPVEMPARPADVPKIAKRHWS